jgi:hypothetical protein
VDTNAFVLHYDGGLGSPPRWHSTCKIAVVLKSAKIMGTDKTKYFPIVEIWSDRSLISGSPETFNSLLSNERANHETVGERFGEGPGGLTLN